MGGDRRNLGLKSIERKINVILMKGRDEEIFKEIFL